MTENAQILVSGIAAGCIFALLGLGFVVVSKATGVLNLAQGGFVVLGAYLTYTASRSWDLPFGIAMAVAAVAVAAFAVLLEAVIVHRVALGNVYTTILVTFGLSIIIPAVASGIWGNAQLDADDPWGLKRLEIGALTITQRDIAVMVMTGLILAVFALFFRFSRLGVGMQAMAMDPEAALAQGVSDRLVHRTAWAIAGALGSLSGSMLATAVGGGVRPGLEHVALLALPVIILGGLTSPLGAVVAGLIVGVVQQFAVVRVPESFGDGFYEVLPYLLMIAVMLVRPEGLFGTSKVRRI